MALQHCVPAAQHLGQHCERDARAAGSALADQATRHGQGPCCSSLLQDLQGHPVLDAASWVEELCLGQNLQQQPSQPEEHSYYFPHRDGACPASCGLRQAPDAHKRSVAHQALHALNEAGRWALPEPGLECESSAKPSCEGCCYERWSRWLPGHAAVNGTC